MPRLSHLRRQKGVVFAVLVTLALAFPLGVLASHQFDDVPDSHDFHADIDAIADAGVTQGCDANSYCPNANVTRGQMAAFLNRLGALGSGKTPVVRAASTDFWSIGCPGDTVLSGGLCFDESTRSTGSVFTASEFCADLGGSFLGRGQIWRLPAALELRAASANGDITISAPEWSQTMYFDDANGPQAATVDGNLVEDQNTTEIFPFRCAAIPLQRDLTLFGDVASADDAEDIGPARETDEYGQPID